MKSEESKENFNKTVFLKCPAKLGNKIITFLRSKELINFQYKISQKGSSLYIPINIKKDVKTEIEYKKMGEENGILLLEKILESLNLSVKNEKKLELKSFEFAQKEEIIERRKGERKTLHEELKGEIPDSLIPLIPRSFDIIGSIAIIELNRKEQEPLSLYKEMIGKKLVEIYSNIDSVFEKSSDVEGVKRTRKFNFLAGKNTTTTLYKENHCIFNVDIEKTFFTPRLSYERNRVSNIKTPFNSYGYIWDMFCGIGPFLIQIAKNFPQGKYIGTDINTHAINLAQKNAEKNHIEGEIEFKNINVRNAEDKEELGYLHNKVSRIIMNLPKKNIEFLDYIPPFVHEKGVLLHIYQFNEKEDPFLDAKKTLQAKIDKIPTLKILKIKNFRVVKPYSPALETTCLDLVLKKEG